MVPSGSLFLIINIIKKTITSFPTCLGEFVILAFRLLTEPCGHFFFLVNENNLSALLMVEQVLDERITDDICLLYRIVFQKAE